MPVSHSPKLVFAVVVIATCAFAADRKELRYNVGPGASVSVVNAFGPVTVRLSPGRQVVISATPASNKVEIENSQNGNRIEVRSHVLQSADAKAARVDYDVQVPADTNLIVRSSDGPIHAEQLRGDLTAEADGATVEVNDFSGGHVRARTVSGAVTLRNISNAYVEVTSVGGNVTLNQVTGPKVSINTTSGGIRYDGSFEGSGDYSLTNHSGDIDVTLPASASVDISARSVSGSVQNDFPFEPKSRTSFAPDPGRAFAGVSNAGGASVKLRSFSGKIRVHKQ
jgi:DUF4097 and DUF4098 domain-containing protein YvlB